MNVLPIPKKLARSMAAQKHYLHRPPPVSFCFGLFEEGIKGIICFGIPASHHMRKGACPSDPSKVIELNRLWVDDCMPRNTESWFISRALKLLPPLIIVSYADDAFGHQGIVYRASNFNFAGQTDSDRKTPRFDSMPAETGCDLLGSVRPKHSRSSSRICGGKVRVARSKKFRYWIVSGTRRDQHNLKKLCAWPKMSWNEGGPKCPQE